MKHYIYYHIDPRDNQIKYVGKGSGNRAFEIKYRRNPKHLRWIKYLEQLGLSIKIEIIEYFNDENQAYKKEKELISELQKNNNTLFNILPGGDPLCGENNPMYGRKRPDNIIRNKANKGKTYQQLYGDRASYIKKKITRNGSDNGMFGRTRKDLADRNRSQKGLSYEILYGIDKSNNIKSKLGGIKIIRNDGKIFYSIKSAAKTIGSTKYLIKRHLDGYSTDVNGYTFQYVT